MTDGARREPTLAPVLDRIDRAERNTKLAILAAALVEAGFMAAYLLLADFGNRVHVLLFLSTIAIYSIVMLSLAAVGARLNRNTLRILKAIEAAGLRGPSE